MRKNPENLPLKIVLTHNFSDSTDINALILSLSNLAIAESNLVKAGKNSAMPHFIAIVKALEDLIGFKFEVVDNK